MSQPKTIFDGTKLPLVVDRPKDRYILQKALSLVLFA
jgi:hypothetical protein